MKLIPLGLIFGLGAWFAAATPARAVEAGEALGSYKVVKGDCLWTIAAQDGIYGNPWVWPLLLDYNQDKIDNPDLIYPGWSLKHPLNPSALRISRAKQYASYYGEESPWPAVATVPPLMAGQKDVASLEGAAPLAAPEKPQSLGRVSGPLFLTLAMLGLAVMGFMIVFMRRRAQRMHEEIRAVEPIEAPRSVVPPLQAPPAELVEAPRSVTPPVGAVAAPAGEAKVEKAPEAAPLYVAQPTESEAILKAEKAEETQEMHEEEEHKKAA